jgi:hypothetical protein
MKPALADSNISDKTSPTSTSLPGTTCMNEGRQQAYLVLIKQLLACRSPEELEPCLTANQDLLDVDFVQSVIEYSNLCEQEGEEQAAHSLNALAKLLADVLGLQVLTEAQLKERHNLLVLVLQATAESNASADVVYPILQANLKILDQGFIQVLHHWIDEVLATSDLSVTQTISRKLSDFSQLIASFPSGTREVNTAIVCLITDKLQASS